MKTYFNIPNLYTNGLVGTHSLELLQLSVNGTNTLPTVFYTENIPTLKNTLTDWQYADCNTGSTTCVIGTNNSFNPFYKEFGLEFSSASGFKRGLSTGSISGRPYGVVETIGVDFIDVKDRNGVLLKGSFFIDIDYSIDFKMVMVHYDGTTQTKYTIEHRAGTCTQYYTKEVGNTKEDILDYGFLSGSQAGTTYIVTDNCIIAPTYNNSVRTVGFMNKSEKPITGVPDKGFKECCYNNIVLADLVDKDKYKNDWTGIHFMRKTPLETCTFQLVYDATVVNLVDNTYGKFNDFSNNVKTMIVDWRKVLIGLGENNYTLRKVITILGVPYTQDSNTFKLKKYSFENADNTIRVESIMDGDLNGILYDNYSSSLRIVGYFGSRNPTYTSDNVIYDDFKKHQVSIEQVNEYVFQGNNIPECIFNELLDFHFMATELRISDYNVNNSSYLIKSLAVNITGGSGVETTYSSRGIDLDYTFTDFSINKKFN